MFFAVLFFLAIGYSSLFAQEGEDGDLFEFKRFIVLPVGAYSEETGMVVGAGAMFFIKPTGSSDALVVMTSLKKQATIINKFVYETERWNFLSHIYLASWPTQFFGIGDDLDENKYDVYTLKNIRIPLSFGTNLFLPENFNYGIETDWEYIVFDYEGKDLNFGNSQRAGIGYNLTYNSTEKNDWPRKGSIVQFRHIFYNANSFIWKNLDTRMYIPLNFLPEGVLALGSYLEDFDGDVPIDRLAQPDGVGQLRGLKKGLLADKTSWVLQSELRTHLFWRCKGTLFYEAAKVGKDIAELNDNKWHTSIGIGGRFLVNKESKTHLRGDISLIDGKKMGMAAQINEAF
ncbi:hypothetical protein R83H12_02970 [Fibrobacteria bacterium R8-3-H12]